MAKEQGVDESEVLTLRRVALALDCSKSHVRKMVYAGVIPAFHRGGVLVVKRVDMERFVDQLKPVKVK